ncbi:uncharacterized protein [Montipora capricornis]|uniref:uncharacterized protein n=1 Tax=Montipora capricornis TaxID=246305 RepID=UPI0035F1C49F
MSRTDQHVFHEILCICAIVSTAVHAIEDSSCPANWTSFQGSCYFFSTQSATWLKARRLCRGIGGDLVTISSDFENAFVNSRLSSSRCLSERTWLGLRRHPLNFSRWVWLDDFNSDPKYTKWHRKEPMNDHLNKNCTAIHSLKSIFWYETDCTAQGCYICVTDANECNKTDTCGNQPCVNIPGGYRCSCGRGYVGANGGTVCEDVDECKIGNGGCPHVCINTPGEYICRCRNGYVTEHNGTVCTIIIAATSKRNESEKHPTTADNSRGNLTQTTESPKPESSEDSDQPAGSSGEVLLQPKPSPLASFGVLFTMTIPLAFIVFFLILCYLKGPDRDKNDKEMGVSSQLIESVSPFLDTAFIDPEDRNENKRETTKKGAKRKNRTSDEDEHLV